MTVNFTLHSAIEADALSEIKVATENDSMTLNSFLNDLITEYAIQWRKKQLDLSALIDQTGLQR